MNEEKKSYCDICDEEKYADEVLHKSDFTVCEDCLEKNTQR